MLRMTSKVLRDVWRRVQGDPGEPRERKGGLEKLKLKQNQEDSCSTRVSLQEFPSKSQSLGQLRPFLLLRPSFKQDRAA